MKNEEASSDETKREGENWLEKVQNSEKQKKGAKRSNPFII